MFRCGVLQSRLPSADVVLVKTNAPCHRWLVWCMRSFWYSRCSPHLTRTLKWGGHSSIKRLLLKCCKCVSLAVVALFWSGGRDARTRPYELKGKSKVLPWLSACVQLPLVEHCTMSHPSHFDFKIPSSFRLPRKTGTVFRHTVYR